MNEKLDVFSNYAEISATLDENLALVFATAKHVPHTFGVEPTTCTVAFFVDLRWTVRRFLRACHTNINKAHHEDLRGACALLRHTKQHFFADENTQNPILPFLDQRLIADASFRGNKLCPTLDGAFSPAIADMCLEARVESLTKQSYLTRYTLGEDTSCSVTYRQASAEARAAYHDVTACVQQVPRCTPTKSNRGLDKCMSTRGTCYCVLHTKNTSWRPLQCESTSKCWCLFDATLRRTKHLLRLSVVAPMFDETSEYFGESVYDARASALVRNFIERTDAVAFGLGTLVNERLSKIRQAATKPRLHLNDFPASICFDVARPITFGKLTYEQVLHATGDRTTICDNLLASGAFADPRVLYESYRWAAGSARHFVRVAFTGFQQYSVRLEMTAKKSANGLLLTRECEEEIYSEMCAEENRALTLTRVLAFQSMAPSLCGRRGNYTSSQHDNVVIFVMAILYMMHAADNAASRLLSRCPIGSKQHTIEQVFKRWDKWVKDVF